MSTAAPQEKKRFMELLHFFTVRTGCCLLCGIDFSVAVIEKEAGRKHEVMDCFAPERKCKERAKAAWSKLPKKGTTDEARETENDNRSGDRSAAQRGFGGGSNE